MLFDVTAEGAENQDVVNALASMDCDLAQGYHWTKPLPMQQFEQWLDVHAMQTRPALVVEPSALKKSPTAG